MVDCSSDDASRELFFVVVVVFLVADMTVGWWVQFFKKRSHELTTKLFSSRKGGYGVNVDYFEKMLYWALARVVVLCIQTM